jgi:uncharacterized membrane protein YeaQ/YmgE (transglycosylase-associated protein family)
MLIQKIPGYRSSDLHPEIAGFGTPDAFHLIQKTEAGPGDGPRSAEGCVNASSGQISEVPMTTIGMVIGWIVFGLVAGAIARLLHPGRDGMGWGGTILLGICGSLLGGGAAYLLGFGTSPMHGAGWILSIVGAIVLLSLGFFSTRPRATM